MKKDETSKKKKVVKGIFKGVSGLALVGLIGYVIKDVKDEYDSMVDENNRLRSFINEHDFYEKRQINIRSSSYEEKPKENESNDETKSEKFDPNNPIYKQSAATMRKLGLNPDGTMKSKSNSQFVKVDKVVTSNGIIMDVFEDVPSGFKIYKPTNRKETSNEKEGIKYGSC